ncbi:TRAP transporter small permease [Balneatrix alpica]|uniref:TRAP transporter small permease n=2 Tax=Balneatrix alpica TaxID=75684 RepID=UPI002739035E|nr:TRAP transporter small permease [Balneatrix alpica]
MDRFCQLANQLSARLNRINQWVVGVLMAALLIDVWIGVLDRYLFHWQISWVEELARYIMIWAILLAVPCCTAAREHIGLTSLTSKLPWRWRRYLGITTDLLCILLFSYLAFSGSAFVAKGWQQLSTVFGLPMAFPYAAIPVAFGLAAVQNTLVLMRWWETQWHEQETVASNAPSALT